ncbi:MAG TPA: glucose-6-phosphate dehydrogenase, partial [Puia sp.]|nr:glucose-6-phosphate dehydrogenase [Puia sp.]
IYQENYTESIPEAYEALILDVLEGDATLFMRSDQVDAAWKVVMPILKAWRKFPKRQLHFYKAGSWGPVAARDLVKPYADHWCQLPVKNKVKNISK